MSSCPTCGAHRTLIENDQAGATWLCSMCGVAREEYEMTDAIRAALAGPEGSQSDDGGKKVPEAVHSATRLTGGEDA